MNYYIDAEAIAEAVQRPTMRFVPIKSNEQLDLQALHRVRDRLISRRTGVINQLRALLLERGVTFRKGRRYLCRQMPQILEDAEQNLSSRMRRLLEELWQEWKNVEEQIQRLSDEIESIAGQDEACQPLLDVLALVLWLPPLWSPRLAMARPFVRDGSSLLGSDWFRDNTPREATPSCSKRGNPYLRRLFMHGVRSVAMHLNRDEHSLGPWMNQLEFRAHHNVFVVALANKLARIAWAVLAKGKIYRPALAMQVGYV